MTKDVCRRITVTPVVYVVYPLSIDVDVESPSINSFQACEHLIICDTFLMEISRLQGTIPYKVRLGLVEHRVIQCIGRLEFEDGLTKDLCRRITVAPVFYVLYP